jgi:hypothetical protein
LSSRQKGIILSAVDLLRGADARGVPTIHFDS